MFVRILSLFCFLCLLQLGRAQDEEAIPEFKKKKEKEPKEQTDEPRPDFKKRSNENSFFKKENVVIGAGFDLSFSYNMALLGLYPSLGYRVFEPLEIGMNMGYNYFGNFNNYNTHSLFGGPYIKVYPYEGYFFQVESVVAHVMYNDNGFKGNIGYGNVLAGIGYNMQMGPSAYIALGIKTNLILNNMYGNNRAFMPIMSFYWRLGQKK